jgi:tRNA-dihydrouridine synthase
MVSHRYVGRPTGRDILNGVTDTAAPTLAPPAERSLRLGPYEVWPPVVLAPMAGITNRAFRQQGGGLYACEMITTVALVERNPKTLKMIAFGDGEQPRSLQLYGVDPDVTAEAVRIVVDKVSPITST